jgi:gliding motility-associated-like protein
LNLFKKTGFQNWLKISAFLFLFFWKANFSIAQPCFFFLTDSIGCAPFKVRVRTCAPPPVAFNFRWTIPPVSPTITLPAIITDTGHTYNDIGSYRILQLLGGNDTLGRQVKVFDKNTRPAFKTSTCGEKLIIEFLDSVFSTYRFFPGDLGPSSILVPKGTGRFEYTYSFAGNSATFPIQIQGEIPATCNKDILTDTISLYKSNQSPIADSLIGLADTLSYRARVRLRADEPFSFQWNDKTNWIDLLSGISQNNNSSFLQNLSIPNLKQKDRVRAASTNGCGNFFPAPDWTLIWPRLKTDNQKITITWPAVDLTNISQMVLLRNGQVFKNLLPFSDTVLVDSGNLVCGSTYCYQLYIKKTIPGHLGELIYKSTPICGQAISNLPPDPVKNLTATVEDQVVKIKGQSSNLAKTFELLRRETEADAYQKILESNALPILDNTADVNGRAYCYKISFKDVCGNQSLLSDSICPVWLRAELPNESEKQFFWTPFLGWKGGVENYELVRTTGFDSPEFLDMGLSQNHTLLGRDKARQKVAYVIRSHAKDKTTYPEFSQSNKIWLVQNSKLRFPDVFTPNEDQVNEVFKCYSLYLTDFQMKIFNAWGNLIFFSEVINKGWDGKIDSKPAPAGPYGYWAKAKDEEGNDIEVSGYFTLIR